MSLDLHTVTRRSVASVTTTNRMYTDRDGRALRGYDAVAYHVDRTATEGDPEITCEWSGATWCFASTENRELFQADPTAYAPAFGGHCAVGKALGFELPGSPKRWRIEDGRLFINKNRLAALQFRPLSRRIRRLAEQAQ